MAHQAKAVAETFYRKYGVYPIGGGEEKPKDQVKEKITVDGKEIEVTKEELIELAQKGKDYTKKSQALAEDKKSLEVREKEVEGLKVIVDEMATNPILKRELNKTYDDVKAGKISEKEGEKKSQKIIDEWIGDTVDKDDRKAYGDLRIAIKEETKEAIRLAVEEATKPLKEEVSLLRNTSTISLSNKVEQDLQKLEDELGKEFIDKHHKEIKSLAIKYPNQSVKKLLYHMADDTALEDALVARAEKRKQKELERKKRGSSTGGEEIVTPKSKYIYNKAGGVTPESIVQRVKERAGMA
ncbi:hypothetical protein LCGC14_0434950 [marine sediment metagenome]|uniref:Uncharacterized protein n=1 Tax=marine sediment metagenome TaxID=412755 RepID=A0A0F9VWC0_9ZZZZ